MDNVAQEWRSLLTTLLARYKKLSFWNKIAVWGSLCSIVALIPLIVSLVIWVLPKDKDEERFRVRLDLFNVEGEQSWVSNSGDVFPGEKWTRILKVNSLNFRLILRIIRDSQNPSQPVPIALYIEENAFENGYPYLWEQLLATPSIAPTLMEPSPLQIRDRVLDQIHTLKGCKFVLSYFEANEPINFSGLAFTLSKDRGLWAVKIKNHLFPFEITKKS